MNLAEQIAETDLYAMPYRMAKVLGQFQKDWGKKKKGAIPKTDDRSSFSLEKYKFFLDSPYEISHKCCDVMKKAPIYDYEKRTGRHGMTAQMADESKLRTQAWLKNGCNAFNATHPVSNPMAFWKENDVLQYIYENNLPICSVYGDVVIDNEIDGQMDITDFIDADVKQKFKTTGCNRTGCSLCAFGSHLEGKENSRFLMLKETHPQMYKMLDIMKNNGYTFREAIEWYNNHVDDKRKIYL